MYDLVDGVEIRDGEGGGGANIAMVSYNFY